MGDGSGSGGPRGGKKRLVGPLGESLAKDSKRARPIPADTIHLPARVTNYEDEMAADFKNIYDDELLGDIYLFGEKDVSAEREALAAFRGKINPEGICRPGYCEPPDLPEVPRADVAKMFAECAERWGAISVDT